MINIKNILRIALIIMLLISWKYFFFEEDYELDSSALSNSGDEAENPGAELYACGSKSYNPAKRFCDERDNTVYKYVTIGAQTWMAENLNYQAEGSKCYKNQPSYCEAYGRLYDWDAAMAGVCPEGWHLPSDKEWKMLIEFVEAENSDVHCDKLKEVCSKAAKYLKDANGWGKDKYSDKYGFQALPGGKGSSGSAPYHDAGSFGYWWSSAGGEKLARNYYMFNTYREFVLSDPFIKSFLLSVRCLRNQIEEEDKL